MPLGFAAFEYLLGEANATVKTLGKRQIHKGGGARGGDIGSDSPALQTIIDTRPMLSDDVKASILAMVLATEMARIAP